MLVQIKIECTEYGTYDYSYDRLITIPLEILNDPKYKDEPIDLILEDIGIDFYDEDTTNPQLGPLHSYKEYDVYEVDFSYSIIDTKSGQDDSIN